VIFFFLDFAAGTMPDERAAKLGEKKKLKKAFQQEQARVRSKVLIQKRV